MHKEGPCTAAGAISSVSVLNTANERGVDGPMQNANMMRLRALVADTTGATPPSKLLVGPRFLPRALYGDYWIVAVSPEQPRAGLAPPPPSQSRMSLPRHCHPARFRPLVSSELY